MIKVNIVCVGKIKESYFKEAINEYLKRLSSYCLLKVFELTEVKIPLKSNDTIEKQIKTQEGKLILNKINKDDYAILLDLNGESFSSESLANNIQKLIDRGVGNISFIIGGSLGVSEDVKQRSNQIICFSKMTFPHQMIRVFLLEQVYRSFKINNNETYHK